MGKHGSIPYFCYYEQEWVDADGVSWQEYWACAILTAAYPHRAGNCTGRVYGQCTYAPEDLITYDPLYLDWFTDGIGLSRWWCRRDSDDYACRIWPPPTNLGRCNPTDETRDVGVCTACSPSGGYVDGIQPGGDCTVTWRSDADPVQFCAEPHPVNASVVNRVRTFNSTVPSARYAGTCDTTSADPARVVKCGDAPAEQCGIPWFTDGSATSYCSVQQASGDYWYYPVPLPESSSGLRGGAIAGIVVGCVVGLALLLLTLVCAIRQRKRAREINAQWRAQVKPAAAQAIEVAAAPVAVRVALSSSSVAPSAAAVSAQSVPPAPRFSVPGCPNTHNRFHQCPNYCEQTYGNSEQAIERRKQALNAPPGNQSLAHVAAAAAPNPPAPPQPAPAVSPVAAFVPVIACMPVGVATVGRFCSACGSQHAVPCRFCAQCGAPAQTPQQQQLSPPASAYQLPPYALAAVVDPLHSSSPEGQPNPSAAASALAPGGPLIDYPSSFAAHQPQPQPPPPDYPQHFVYAHPTVAVIPPPQTSEGAPPMHYGPSVSALNPQHAAQSSQPGSAWQ